MDWGFTIAVVVTGIVVVFVVLTILVMLCTSMGAFFSTENQVSPQVQSTPTPKVEVVVEPTVAVPQPEIEEGISQEVVAAISASIAVIMGEEASSYTIASIKQSGQQTNITDKRATRTAWSNAGFVENTRPF